MNSYNYSYNVLINRLEAFAAGHFLIKRFTHGQIDLADQLQDDQYPFMHVTPDTIEPVQGGMQFGFHIMFADIPRDKEYKAEYQREVISDCVRLGQDLVAEVKNGLQLFGFDVQLINDVVFEPFMEEQKNTVTGVAFTIKLEVPWDWSACDIPAIWSVGGASGSGGSGTGYGITLQTNGVDNVVQTLLNLEAGTNITITDNGNGTVTIDAAGGGGGGGGPYVSTEWNANHTTAQGNPYQIGDRVWYNGSVYACIANNDGINPSNPAYWTLQSAGYRLRQTPVDWNAVNGDYQILNKPFIPAYLDDLADVNAGSPNDGDILVYFASGNEWKNQPNTGGGTVTSVGLLVPSPGVPAFSVSGSPVTTSGNLQINALGTSLQYIDGEGALQTFPNVPKFLSDLISGSAPGQLLQWNGTQWVVISMLALDDLSDVSATTPSNGQVLAYNTGTGKWEAYTLPSLSGYVPYVGATQDVDLDTFKLSASSVYIEGTSGNGHLHLKHQSADATATGQSTSLWADTNGDIKWKNDGNYKTTLKTSANVADRTYTFPDEDCTLMPRNAAITGATKTKITYDADGLVTAGADLAAGDMPTGIDAANIGTGSVSNTEFGYLDGVTSAIQTQLNNKKDTVTYGNVYAVTVGASSTVYAAVSGLTTFNATESNRHFAVPVAGTLKNLYVKMSGTQSATGTLVITMRNNASSSAVTVTVSSADGASPTKSDNANTLAVAAGDLLAIQLINNATVASASVVSISFVIERS